MKSKCEKCSKPGDIENNYCKYCGNKRTTCDDLAHRLIKKITDDNYCYKCGKKL